MVDIYNMTTVELKELREKIDTIEAAKRKDEILAVRKACVDLITKAGFTVADIFGGGTKVKSTGTGQRAAKINYIDDEGKHWNRKSRVWTDKEAAKYHENMKNHTM